jgi:hypothetical protein
VELAPDGVLRPARLVRIEFAVEGWRATLMAAPKDAAPPLTLAAYDGWRTPAGIMPRVGEAEEGINARKVQQPLHLAGGGDMRAEGGDGDGAADRKINFNAPRHRRAQRTGCKGRLRPLETGSGREGQAD